MKDMQSSAGCEHNADVPARSPFSLMQGSARTAALKEQMRTRHILRMQQGHCSIEAGFVWSDLLTDLERTADHCSNIAGCVLDAANHGLNLHETLRAMRADPDFRRAYGTYAEKYRLQAV